MTLREQLYEKLEKLSDKQYIDFYVQWFGQSALWSQLQESIDSVEDRDIQAGLDIIADYEK